MAQDSLKQRNINSSLLRKGIGAYASIAGVFEVLEEFDIYSEFTTC
jgi:hypothetical protein